MRLAALNPLAPARADDASDPYRVERLRAQTHTERAARPQATRFIPLPAVRNAASEAIASPPKLPIEPVTKTRSAINPLGEAYTAHCLKLAIEAYHAQQARQVAHAQAANLAAQEEMSKQQARTNAANDLGTIQGLLPQQAYRYAAGVPPVVAEQMSVAAFVAPDRVGPVAAAAKARSSTDEAHGRELDRAAKAARRTPESRFLFPARSSAN
ncbi:hypothetical protein [Achromobacter mucicolens]|uniref:hypothetical protein n=1 Tax=Achromobacter mucicolens TaxID=1389922 RepID=UPI002448719D|nr:hypothetical protein [Achromobacter mucicolens]MDH1521239.1 hypothetical protein [Achromobacter mucicolens]